MAKVDKKLEVKQRNRDLKDLDATIRKLQKKQVDMADDYEAKTKLGMEIMRISEVADDLQNE